MLNRPQAMKRGIAYGPHVSWRIGRSLGIDLLGSKEKYCSFDCIYCELGIGRLHVVRRRNFVTTVEVKEAVAQVKDRDFDYVTFSGSGEPTLASNLGEVIDLVREAFHKPVAVLTNSSLIPREDVRQELLKADFVIAKIDAPDEELYRKINQPWVKTSLLSIIESIILFQPRYRGKLALQMMFTDANKTRAEEMAVIASQIAADEVQLCTPVRQCPILPLSIEEMSEIKKAFDGIKGMRMVYDNH